MSTKQLDLNVPDTQPTPTIAELVGENESTDDKIRRAGKSPAATAGPAPKKRTRKSKFDTPATTTSSSSIEGGDRSRSLLLPLTLTTAKSDEKKKPVISNHRGRYSLLVVEGKDHLGRKQYTYYEAQTRKLSQKHVDTLQSANVHVHEHDNGPLHKILYDAQNSPDTIWKRVDGATVNKHILVAYFNNESLIDVCDDNDGDEDSGPDDDDIDDGEDTKRKN
jgi:hypothetical protein